MKCSMRNAVRSLLIGVLSLAAALPASVSPAVAQGVTTGSMAGVVLDANMPVRDAQVIAIHALGHDLRGGIPGRRPLLHSGHARRGPHSVTVAHGGTGGTAFAPQTKEDVTVNLGVSSDLSFTVTAIAQEEVTVTAIVDPVFSSSRTGAATSVDREEIALIPTLNGRISDVTRLTPQSSGSQFAGADNRMNNITVDGSSFNTSFGLGGQPGDRTNVAPISLEAIEQIQVAWRPSTCGRAASPAPA